VPGQRRTLRLSFQHDELLAQERILQYQFRLTARQVQGCIQDKIMVVRPRPLTKMAIDSLADRILFRTNENGENFMACLSRWSCRQ
jgi:hypothetical protein